MVETMSVPYDETVLTANECGTDKPRGTDKPMVRAALGAACISSSAIMVTLAHQAPATTALFRCALALPVLIPLALLEQRRRGPRPLRSRLYAGLAGLFLAVDLVL
jgi:drug/metabolite transporter (DMT)-like permease